MLRENSSLGRVMRRPGVAMAAVVWILAAAVGLMAQEAAENKGEEKKGQAAGRRQRRRRKDSRGACTRADDDGGGVPVGGHEGQRGDVPEHGESGGRA